MVKNHFVINEENIETLSTLTASFTRFLFFTVTFNSKFYFLCKDGNQALIDLLSLWKK